MRTDAATAGNGNGDVDATETEGIDLPYLATRTLMASEDDKRALAAEVLAFARRLGPRIR